MDDDLVLQPRDVLILAALMDGEQHGYGLIGAVAEISAGEVELDPGNLYRVLRRMDQCGWIELVPGMRGAGAPRRTYAITSTGHYVLRMEALRLEALLRQIGPAVALARELRPRVARQPPCDRQRPRARQRPHDLPEWPASGAAEDVEAAPPADA